MLVLGGHASHEGDLITLFWDALDLEQVVSTCSATLVVDDAGSSNATTPRNDQGRVPVLGDGDGLDDSLLGDGGKELGADVRVVPLHVAERMLGSVVGVDANEDQILGVHPKEVAASSL
jgi:hypothetical protein